MVSISRARVSHREEIEELIALYHASEGLTPMRERIAWAVDQQLRNKFAGVLLLAREVNNPVGVALAVYTPSAELGRVLTVNDFFVRPDYRRRGVGRELVNRLLEESRLMGIDEINLEVVVGNKAAAGFWRSVGFELADRALFKLKLEETPAHQMTRPSSRRR